MKKKIIYLLLMLILMVSFFMTGCSSKKPESYVSDYEKLEAIEDKINSIDNNFESKYELKKEIKKVIREIKKIKVKTKEGKAVKKYAIKYCKKMRYYGAKYFNDDPAISNINYARKMNKYLTKYANAAEEFIKKYEEKVSGLYKSKLNFG